MDFELQRNILVQAHRSRLALSIHAFFNLWKEDGKVFGSILWLFSFKLENQVELKFELFLPRWWFFAFVLFYDLVSLHLFFGEVPETLVHREAVIKLLSKTGN